METRPQSHELVRQMILQNRNLKLYPLINLSGFCYVSTGNFNTVLAMHARSSTFRAPERAEKTLRRYRELCSQGILRNKPDAYSYSLLLKTWYVQKQRTKKPKPHISLTNRNSCTSMTGLHLVVRTALRKLYLVWIGCVISMKTLLFRIL
jgi:hypothetical protein